MQSEPTFLLSREAEHLMSDRTLRRRYAGGHVVRLRPGVYMDRTEWAALDGDARYRATVRAAALVARSRSQASHDSAAALWRLPSLGPWPSLVHELAAPASGGLSRVGVLRHGLGFDARPVTIDGVLVTSFTRTLVDISCTVSFVRAVAMVDDGLRRIAEGDFRFELLQVAPTTDDLMRELDGLLPYRGSAKAARVLDFATEHSESVGESLSRVQFRALGYPAPELQVGFSDADGFIGFADFYWRELDLIVEFDGWSKYGDARRFQRQLSPADILRLEKSREDRMRRVVRRFARLDWETSSDRRRLAAQLRPHGLHPRREPFSDI